MSGFFRHECDDWLDVVDGLTKPWREGAMRSDLRWWADQLRLGKVKRIPGYRDLAERWGVSPWTARQKVKAEAWWADPFRADSAQTALKFRAGSAQSDTDKPDVSSEVRADSAQTPRNAHADSAIRVVKTQDTDTDTVHQEPQREEPPCPVSKPEPSTSSASAAPAVASAQPNSTKAPSTSASTKGPSTSASTKRTRRRSSSEDKTPQSPEEQALWLVWTANLGGGEPLMVAITSMRSLLSAGRKVEELIEVAIWSGRSSHKTAVFNREQGNHRGATPWRPANFERYLEFARQGRPRDWRDVGTPPHVEAAKIIYSDARSSPCPTWEALPMDVRTDIGQRVMDEQLENVDLDVDAELERRAVEYNSKVIQLKVKERA